MKLNDEEIYELFRVRAREDYFGSEDSSPSEYEKARNYAKQKLRNHKSIHDKLTDDQKEYLKKYEGPIEVGLIETPQRSNSSREYTKWMAEVWKKNDERNNR